MQGLLGRTSEIYAVNYFGVIIIVSLLECVAPQRAAADTLRLRWLGNFGLSILDTLLLRALLPVAGLGWALLCAQHRWGLFNAFKVPYWIGFAATLLALDLTAYLQHNALHRVPLLWTCHRAHHTDHDVDFTTGARFHPFESLITTTVMMLVTAALGAAPAAVFVSELLATTLTFVEHSNIRVSPFLNRVLCFALVTPDMHRVHHSMQVHETNSNFGTVFPWWDRMYGTYLEPDTSSAGRKMLKFGLSGFRDAKHQTLPWMLAQPFLHPDETAERISTPEPPEWIAGSQAR